LNPSGLASAKEARDVLQSLVDSIEMQRAALGNVFDDGRVLPFRRGGVVSGPTLFPMARGMGLMGEAGPEAVMPLARDAGGNLGVRASGALRQAQGEGVVVQIIDQRGRGAPAEVSQSQGPDGRALIRVLIRDEVARGLGAGDFDGPMAGSFGLRRRGATR